MSGGAKLFGHSLHPILIVFPLGLLGGAAIFEVFYYLTARSELAVVTFWMIAGGLIGGALAAPFGWIDWFAIPAGTRAKTTGLLHGLVNVGVLVLFGSSLYLRWTADVRPGTSATAALGLGFGLAMIGGWLGGELVERLGIGVHEGANPNAPSSLTKDPPISNTYRATKS